MVRKLIEWAVANPLIILILAVFLAAAGAYAFINVNVEAYPDPAPAIIEVVAQNPGASAEEMERQVTIPLEVALAGMPGLQTTRSKSLFGLSHLRNQFDYGVDFDKAKQEVINRLQQAQLPPGVTPQISPQSPTGEIYRYTIVNPKDATGRPVYTLRDLKAVQDYTLQRELLRVPRIAGVVGEGGAVKRYEVHPDPRRMARYGITLAQLQNAIASSNVNVGGDYLPQGQTVQVVRGIGLIGGGQDPLQQVLGMKDPMEAAAFLRAEEDRRIQEVRSIVLSSVNNVPVRVEDVVDGGPVQSPTELGRQGVVVGNLTRLGKVSMSRPRRDAEGNEVRDADGRLVWDDADEKVEGIVLLRKGYESTPALRDVAAKIEELNQPGRLPPGMKIEPYYNRTKLIGLTTETVEENLLLGLALVTAILLMFLSNVRTALIVALNVPLALLFAFAVLYARGKSANLLSIGAVDFGIIVDSTVILVENIYRHVSSGHDAERPLAERIIRAASEVEQSLFYSTVIMVCALLPLFTMKGPEGQIFGPMADTYAFALGGALLLALTVSPALCLLLFKRLKATRPNFLVRSLQWFYLVELKVLLKLRWLALIAFIAVVAVTGWVASGLGREFMPELEEGNLYIRGTFPINIAFETVGDLTREARRVIRQFPEVDAVVPQVGRPDDGTDPSGYYNVEIFCPLRPFADWPAVERLGRARTKAELVKEMDDELSRLLPGVEWDFSQIIRDNVMEALSGVKGENSVKIFGPDLNKLEELAFKVKDALAGVPGVDNAGVFRIQGQSNLEFPIDRLKCSRWNVSVADVQNVIQTAVGGKACTQMVEGEKSFDVTLRYPEPLRSNEQAILQIPVDVTNHQVTGLPQPAQAATPVSGSSAGVSASGTSASLPSLSGSVFNTAGPVPVPRRPLGDLVAPPANGQFLRPGASTISREQGQRLIAVKFGVHSRALSDAVADARTKVEPLLQPPYRAEWSGEFQEMEEAEARIVKWFGLSQVLIFLLLYLAFHSLRDAVVVYSNVIAMSLGGVWALVVTHTVFNISAAVGFISILGVAVMNGLLFVSAFNRLRARGVDLRLALLEGVGHLVRPVTMTALAAILGLLPAALSTKIGSQSQRPLAIVVVGGMLATLLLMNLVPVLYSFYGNRTPPEGASAMAH